jgi:hypothetical protein
MGMQITENCLIWLGVAAWDIPVPDHRLEFMSKIRMMF